MHTQLVLKSVQHRSPLTLHSQYSVHFKLHTCLYGVIQRPGQLAIVCVALLRMFTLSQGTHTTPTIVSSYESITVLGLQLREQRKALTQTCISHTPNTYTPTRTTAGSGSYCTTYSTLSYMRILVCKTCYHGNDTYICGRYQSRA